MIETIELPFLKLSPIPHYSHPERVSINFLVIILSYSRLYSHYLGSRVKEEFYSWLLSYYLGIKTGPKEGVFISNLFYPVAFKGCVSRKIHPSKIKIVVKVHKTLFQDSS